MEFYKDTLVCLYNAIEFPWAFIYRKEDRTNALVKFILEVIGVWRNAEHRLITVGQII